ncbi:MAG: TetR/AcrR family transcriptional regulator [Chloroflexota bacterium]|nr:TetR/AcrR family transcriptional regulator [Chloroflexota bacterium]
MSEPMIESKNAVRSERTRTALIAAARDLFATGGYAATSTPDIVRVANVSRGALYHHFADKLNLFRAVVEAEQATVAQEVDRPSQEVDDPVAAIRLGGEAFLEAMRDPGRRRILLIDGPAVLGVAAMREIDARHAGRTLVEGVQTAIAAGRMRSLPPVALAALLNAAFDRVAEADDEGGEYRAALWGLIEGLRTGPDGAR